MKNSNVLFVSAIMAIGAMGFHGEANASCQNICVRLYNLCVQNGEGQSACAAERSDCLAQCVATLTPTVKPAMVGKKVEPELTLALQPNPAKAPLLWEAEI